MLGIARTTTGGPLPALSFYLRGTPPGPNRQRGQHWAETYRSQQEWKGDTALVAKDAMNKSGITDFPWPAVDIALTFRFAKATRRDIPNLVAAAKPIIDGIVAAGIVKDDSYVYLDEVRCRVQRHLEPQPGVVVLVTPCAHR